MPVGVSYVGILVVSHVTAHLLNYLILNSEVLFGEDTLN